MATLSTANTKRTLIIAINNEIELVRSQELLRFKKELESAKEQLASNSLPNKATFYQDAVDTSDYKVKMADERIKCLQSHLQVLRGKSWARKTE